jgi:hypothetical protein
VTLKNPKGPCHKKIKWSEVLKPSLLGRKNPVVFLKLDLVHIAKKSFTHNHRLIPQFMEFFVKNAAFMAIVTSIIPKRPFRNNSKKIKCQNKLAFQRYFGARN